MEQQVADILSGTLQTNTRTRQSAETSLVQLYSANDFPVALVSIGSQKSFKLEIRQSALLNLKTFVLKTWSPAFEEYGQHAEINDATKEQIRRNLLEIALRDNEETKITSAASYAVSKIASADFPEQWPDLLTTLLQLAPHASEDQLHGVLVVLSSLVEDGFDEEQFGKSCVELVNALYGVVADTRRKGTLRGLAASIFRACFDTVEMIQDSPSEKTVKQFLQETSDRWLPLFVDILSQPLAPIPSEEEELRNGPEVLAWRGVIALRLQVIKALQKFLLFFPRILQSRSFQFFRLVWQGLQTHLALYHTFYVHGQREGKLEDIDRVPFSLDYLVVDEIDIMRDFMEVPEVMKELCTTIDQNSNNAAPDRAFIDEVVKQIVGYGHITNEDGEMWDIDVNCFLAEETSETANYTPRSAVSILVYKAVKAHWPILDSLQAYTQAAFSDQRSSAKNNEAALYTLKLVLNQVSEYGQRISPQSAMPFMDCARFALGQEDPYLRARAYIVAGQLCSTTAGGLPELQPSLAEATLQAAQKDSSDVVKVACIRALQDHIESTPVNEIRNMQLRVLATVSAYFSGIDPEDLSESESLLDSLVETLRNALMKDPSFSMEQGAIELFFTLASHGSTSMNTMQMVTEAFDTITETMTAQGMDAYTQLCKKVIPFLVGAFDSGNLTDNETLTDLAIELLSSLADHGPSPLPQGFVAATMPKLYRLIFSAVSPNTHQSASVAMTHIVNHDPEQVFSWQDPDTGKGGLELALLMIDRLLGPEAPEQSASEVGSLIAEVIEKAGADKLGPFLMNLLQVVAVRLSDAKTPAFIQDLVMVYVRLSVTNPQDVLNFLAEVRIPGQDPRSGLEVVMKKWLETSVNFAGFEATRQNIVALTNIYKLHDQRLANIQVEGDLVVGNTSRIKTRARAKQDPDQYTMIPVPLKVIKVLVAELGHASPRNSGLIQRPSMNGEFGDDEDEEWEDDPSGLLDLGNPTTRADLMGLADQADWGVHEVDEDTQKFLVGFFNSVGADPDFAPLFHQLTDDERTKLHSMNNQ